VYLVWDLGGHVRIQVTRMSGSNAVVSGLFFGGSSAAGSASFLATDSKTQGSWKGVYGSDGYNILGDTAGYPAYAAVVPSGQKPLFWAASTADPRALQQATSPAGVAAAWSADQSFAVDIALSGSSPHKVSLYFVDWDYQQRAQTLTVIDAGSGAVLDTRTLSNFSGGVYLTWNLGGHVKIQVTRTAGPAAVVSGLFFQ
jgi:hypothetical protein